MILGIENGQLLTDFDCKSFNIKNLGALSPLPAGLVSSTDPRLSDARNPLPGSVVDASVNAGAAIVQSKINFNSTIPAAWLGTGAAQAAKGSLAEYVANKGAANGYAGLDGTGKVPAAQMPVGAGLGTVTSVGLALPADFGISGSPVTGAGTLSAAWNSVAAKSWFGNSAGVSQPPAFSTGALPTTLIPSLPASIITSGVFALGQIPPLPASQITSGTFALAQIPALPASQITSGTFAPAQIPPLDASIITTGVLAVARGGMPPAGAAGQVLQKIDGTSLNTQWATPVGAVINTLQTAAASPTGTTSTAGVMMGLGSAATLTPEKSGMVFVTVWGYGTNSNNNASYKTTLYYGTGGAPANAAPLTGTSVATIVGNPGNSNQSIPFSMTAIIGPLTLGTAYWFDLALAASAGTATLSEASITAAEF